jgi:hypothetical protein
MPGRADRAINMALRVVGIGEVERDFKRVGDAGNKSFAEVEKSANGAAREVSEYTRRLRETVAITKSIADQIPELSKPTAQSRADRSAFILANVKAEKERIVQGLPGLADQFREAETAATGFGMSLGRVAAVGAGAAIALRVLYAGVKASFDAFEEHELAISSFNAKLALAGNRSGATAGEIEDMARRIVDSTLQTEAAALKGGQALAKISGLSKEAMEQALDASARFADAVGEDLPSVIQSTTAPVLQALADKDMKALIAACADLDDSLKANIYSLAEAGRTADAQKVFIEGLRDAAGDGPNGLTTATNQLTDAWTNLKTAFAENIAEPAAAGLNWLAGYIDTLRGRIDAAARSWRDLLSGRAPLSGLNFDPLQPTGKPRSVRIDLEDARKRTTRRDAQGAGQEAAAAAVKAFEARHGGSGRRRSGGGGRSRAEAEAARAERERQRDERNREAAAQQLARLDRQLIDARTANVSDFHELARLAEQEVRAESRILAASVDKAAATNPHIKAQSDLLHELIAQIEAEKLATIATKEKSLQLAEELADYAAANDNQRDLLQAQAAIADTVGERRRLALALLELDQEEEKERLRTVIAQAALGKATEEEARRAQARLAALEQIHPAERRGVLDQHKTSLERFIDDTDPGKIEDQINDLVYDELMSVRRGINTAITDALGVDDPLIAGLLEILLDQILFRPIAEILQSRSGAGGGLGSIFGAVLGSIGGGITAGTAARLAPDVMSNIAANPALFASGTPSVPTGRDFYVGDNGRERMRYHGGGRLEVISGPRLHREAANDAGGITLIQNNWIPERADPRRTQSGIARANARSLAIAQRKGLAMPGGRR